MTQDQFSEWNSIKVKAKYDYTCAECGSKENIQAHDPTGKHKDWHIGIALCGLCHAKKHPNVPLELFLSKSHQPFWPNISARQLADDIGVHNRTIIRRAKSLGIPSGQPLSDKDKVRIANFQSQSQLHIYSSKIGEKERARLCSYVALTTGQSAKLLGCHTCTIIRAIKRGNLPATKYGSSGWHRIILVDLEKYTGRSLS